MLFNRILLFTILLLVLLPELGFLLSFLHGTALAMILTAFEILISKSHW